MRTASGRARHLLAWVRTGVALTARPALWGTAVVQVLALAGPRWWRRWPPLPRPDPGYLRFRLETAYGDTDAAVVPADVVEYLAWCRRARPAAR